MGTNFTPNPGAMVWLPDLRVSGQPMVPLMLEGTDHGPVAFSSPGMIFRRSDWSVQPPALLQDYWIGIFHMNNELVIGNTKPVASSAHSDNTSILNSTPSGIVDLPNQSRVRATVINIDWSSWQLIQPNTWTPVNFTNPLPGLPLVAGTPSWDEQVEFTVAISPNQAVPPVNAFFTAQEDGFYQVNARCEFETDEYWENGSAHQVFMRPNAYVAIAIYFDFQGQWLSFAIGNHLQITNNTPLNQSPLWEDETETMFNNNAPNVSDIVYLQAGDRISIWVFHWAYTPMMLRVGDNTLYLSIHKVS
jgi:hypothetical protein